MVNPVVLIHFLPLEQYPPVMNLIEFIAKQEGLRMVVLTTGHRDETIVPFNVESDRVVIRRLCKLEKDSSSVFRYFQYLKFYSLSLTTLLALRPVRILYYETLSSFPVYIFWKYINRDVKIFIHYHEYTSPADYQSGMRLSRYFHQKEKKMYPYVEWLSHTNPTRLKLFMEDEGLHSTSKYFVMPNYPGRHWCREQKTLRQASSTAIVYAGAVSRETMYFENFVSWVISRNGQISFDIYSNNISKADKDWLSSLADPNIRLHPGVAYSELPGLLSQFDIGVILYKGHIPNYVHNAPNKLFEYLACGLDVWVPSIMTECLSYYTDHTFPKVIPVDFSKLDLFRWEDAVDRSNLSHQPSDYCFESVYPTIVSMLYP